MGKCQFCGRDTGLFRNRHKECSEKHEAGRKRIVALARQAAISPTDYSTFSRQIKEVATAAYINTGLMTDLITTGWEEAVAASLDKEVLSSETEHALMEFRNAFSLSQDQLDRHGAYSKVAKAAILRDILEGKLPQRVQLEGTLPFNLQKGETLIWLFTSVKYYEQRSKTHYVGGSHGFSVRVAKGLYYRLGGFRGDPVTTSQAVRIDTGYLGVTDRHLYFAGAAKAFRIRYEKVVSFMAYADGISIQRDAMTAKPQAFLTGDGWFTYNLITNLARRAAV